MVRYHDSGTICKASIRDCPLGEVHHIEATDQADFERQLGLKIEHETAVKEALNEIAKLEDKNKQANLQLISKSLDTVDPGALRREGETQWQLDRIKTLIKENLGPTMLLSNSLMSEGYVSPEVKNIIMKIAPDENVNANKKDKLENELTEHKELLERKYEDMQSDYAARPRTAALLQAQGIHQEYQEVKSTLEAVQISKTKKDLVKNLIVNDHISKRGLNALIDLS